MSMNNTQRWMGGVVLLCGGTLLAALLIKGKQELNQNGFELPSLSSVIAPKKTTPTNTQNEQAVKSFTLDVQTEQRLLEQQRLAREKSVAEQEAKAAEFLQLQQQAEAAAAQKAADEYAAKQARQKSEQESSDNIPPELNNTSLVATPTNASAKTTLKSTDATAITAQQKALQDQRKAEVSRLAAQQKAIAEQKRKSDAENLALTQKAQAEKKRLSEEIRVLEAKRKATLEKLQAEEQKRKALEASQRLAQQKADLEAKKRAEIESRKRADAEEARRILEGDSDKPSVATVTTNTTTVKPNATLAPKASTNSKPTRGWVVQVALAATQANADALVSKLRAKGYNVTTSRTSKGVRVLVGANGNDRTSADATRQKISKDASLGMNSAWVMDWQPPQ